MSDNETPDLNAADSAPDNSPSVATHPIFPQRIGRREFVLGAAAAGLPAIALLRRMGDKAAPNAQIGPSATTDATPALSAAATPTSAPQPFSATPTITSQGEMIGGLHVVRDQRPTYDAEPERGGGLQMVLTAGDNLNFSPVAFRQDFQILASILDPLVWVDEVTMEPKPWLATSWKWSDKGETITYTLRDDVTWHDGSSLTAADVAFSLMVARDDIDSAVRNFFTNMEAVDVLDDQTVRVRLSAPDGSWLFNASNLFIVQQAQYAEHWNDLAEGERTLSDYRWDLQAPRGTGPWVAGKFSDSSIELTRNGDYWAGSPSLDTLRLTWNTDATDRLVAWTGGSADLLWPIRPSDIDTASQTIGWLYAADAASVMFAAFNFNNPARDPSDLLSDLRVRQALSLAIDRERYAREVFRGFIHADAAGTVAQPWAHDASLVNPPRDVAQARELLRKSGWEDRDGDGFVERSEGNPLVLTAIVQNDDRPELIAVLNSIVADLKEAGVALVVQQLGADQFRDRWTRSHEFDLIAYAYNLFAGFSDFDLYGSKWDIRQNSQGWNPGGYHNRDVDKLIEQILEAYDPSDQRDLLVKLQRATNEDLFGLWFGFPQDLILVRPALLGFQPNKMWQTWDTRKLWRPGAFPSNIFGPDGTGNGVTAGATPTS